MSRKPNLLGFDPESIPGIADYYEFTMADTNMVAGIGGREAVFNAAVRGIRDHKVVHEDTFESDGWNIIMDGKSRKFETFNEDLLGKKYHVIETEPDNYYLNMGLEQILGFLLEWNMNDDLISIFNRRGLSHETLEFLRKKPNLDLTVEAIPEGIPIFGQEPYMSVQGSFEQSQFPESAILGIWGYQTAVATQASYVKNILEEFGRLDILTLEGGSRRLSPGAALHATRAVLAGGFTGTSLVEIARQYPELLYRIGGSSGHSAILHIGSDEKAFELQLRAYYHIQPGDSGATIRELISKNPGVGPTFLLDTFDSGKGLEAAIRVLQKYDVIKAQVRNDSGDPFEWSQNIKDTLQGEDLSGVQLMLSDDIKPWNVYDLLQRGADFNALLMGTYAVNPYKLPGAVYKLSADQADPEQTQLVDRCKVSLNNPGKSTLPGRLDVYRVIGKDGKADRDHIIKKDVETIDTFLDTKKDDDYIKLNQPVMVHGELVYDLPDMCQIIENAAYHLSLLRPEHKRFKNAEKYPVFVSPAVQGSHDTITRQYATGQLH